MTVNEAINYLEDAKIEFKIPKAAVTARKTNEALDMAIKALKQMNSSENQDNWIPVSERMPEPRIDVWCNSDMGQMVGYYDEYAETWYGRDYLELIVTAWMPLPEPYRGERTEE